MGVFITGGFNQISGLGGEFWAVELTEWPKVGREVSLWLSLPPLSLSESRVFASETIQAVKTPNNNLQGKLNEMERFFSSSKIYIS